MSDTTDARDESAPRNTEPINDSAELRDAIRSIEAIGEDRTGVEEAEPDSESDNSAAADTSTPLDEDSP